MPQPKDSCKEAEVRRPHDGYRAKIPISPTLVGKAVNYVYLHRRKCDHIMEDQNYVVDFMKAGSVIHLF